MTTTSTAAIPSQPGRKRKRDEGAPAGISYKEFQVVQQLLQGEDADLAAPPEAEPEADDAVMADDEDDEDFEDDKDEMMDPLEDEEGDSEHDADEKAEGGVGALAGDEDAAFEEDAHEEDDEDVQESTVNAGVGLDLNVRALTHATFSTLIGLPHTIRVLSQSQPFSLGAPFPKGMCCMWDTCEVTDERPTFQIIVRRDDRHKIAETYGAFCSVECAIAKSNHLGREDNMRDRRKQWLLDLVGKRSVTPAPDPAILTKFGGGMDVAKYRTLNAAGIVCRLVLPTEAQEYRFTNQQALLAWAQDDTSKHDTVLTEKERLVLRNIVQRTLSRSSVPLPDQGPGSSQFRMPIPDSVVRDIREREAAVDMRILEHLPAQPGPVIAAMAAEQNQQVVTTLVPRPARPKQQKPKRGFPSNFAKAGGLSAVMQKTQAQQQRFPNHDQAS